MRRAIARPGRFLPRVAPPVFRGRYNQRRLRK